MTKFLAPALIALMALSACTNGTGEPGQGVYRIKRHQTGKIQFRMLDSVNSLRQAASVAPLQFSSELNAAAATHSRDMSAQNRPWHFGSNGSSPLDRVQRSGFNGTLVGENISETFETELKTLSAWMDQSDTKAVILSPAATHMGFAWHQDENGKIWWTLVTGASTASDSQ
ncbi:MAG: CAP domain-containing protein [Halocynthiibacter sp.]